MELKYIVFFFVIALCSAVEDTQERDSDVFPEDLQDFVRRLTQQQMQTTQNLQSSLLSQLNRPRMRSRIESESYGADSPQPYLEFPFQSNSGEQGGSQSYASSSVSMKRPHTGSNVEAHASAYASVKDVNNEDHIDEIFNSDAENPLRKSSTPSGYQKSSTLQKEILATLDDDSSTRKGEPTPLKQQQVVETIFKEDDSFSDVYFVAIVAGCCAVGIFGVIAAGVCFYKLQKSRKAAADVDYPAYGVTGPNKDVSSPNGDRKLAQSAQMYHYQHQKQQMIAVEKAGSTKNTSASDVDSEEENEEGDYTVYECPGLAPTGEMEVKNPLFHDDSTPVSPPVLTSKSDSNQNN